MGHKTKVKVKRSSNKRFVRIVEAVIKDSKGRVLLLQRSTNNSTYVGKWQLPGGKAHKKESAIHAINREVFEETGRKCVVVDLLKEITFSEKFKGEESTVELSIFSCKVKGSIILSKDHCKHKFVRASKLIKKILAPVSKKALFD
ncbi:MAG: NUDIX hydrolase [archaeon]|jgi:8-oxo-dGTP diphosphatase